jgi:L-ascorbate metabolism protein UlaG (beta-lactamase superfamily)
MARSRTRAAPSSLLEGLRLERAQASSRFRDGRFHNTAPVGATLKGSPWPTLGEYFFAKQQRVPPAPLPLDDPRAVWRHPPATRLRVTWLGHSTVLLEIDGARVLTDPVFGERVSPLSFAGPKRFHPVPAQIHELPRLDAVLVSHDHYDHLCYASIRELARLDVPFITSLGVGARLEAWGVPASRIVELDWWEEHVLAGGRLSFTATPSQHFSGRGPLDRNATAWSGWVIRGDRHRLFFSGDTGLTEEFREVGRRLGPFDLVMLEIGAFHPSWGDIHLGPENALKALAMLGGGTLLPVHWGTFNLALHAWDEPAETLWQLAKVGGARLLTPRLGAPIEPGLVDEPRAWWRQLPALR